MITVKIEDGCRQPYLSTNHFQTCTTRSLGEHLGKFLKNLTSGLGEDAIRRLLQCNDQIASLKIAAVFVDRPESFSCRHI